MSQTPARRQSAAGFPFSPQDALEFMQKMWNPFGVPVPGFGPGCGDRHPGRRRGRRGDAGRHAVSESGGDVRRASIPARCSARSTSCKIIEGWLPMSLNLMQMSIKTMELQKASLEAMRGSTASEAAARAKGSGSRRT